MTDYEKHFRQRGLTQYTLDGAINPKEWSASNVKILFYLKENYGYQKYDVMNLQDYAHGWLDENNKTYVKSVTLAAAIQLGLQRCYPLSQDEIKTIEQDSVLLHATLDKMAVVNIKKHSGKSKSNDAEIRDESHRNAALLKSQIRELAPTIVVAGGTVCWHSLIYDLGLFDAVPECQKFNAVICDTMVLCHCNHPSAWSGGGFHVEPIHRTILSTHQAGHCKH